MLISEELQTSRKRETRSGLCVGRERRCDDAPATITDRANCTTWLRFLLLSAHHHQGLSHRSTPPCQKGAARRARTGSLGNAQRSVCAENVNRSVHKCDRSPPYIRATVQFRDAKHLPFMWSRMSPSLHFIHQSGLVHSRQLSAQPSVFGMHESLAPWKPSKHRVQLLG